MLLDNEEDLLLVRSSQDVSLELLRALALHTFAVISVTG